MSGITGLGGVDYSALVQRAKAATKATSANAEFKAPDIEAPKAAKAEAPGGLDDALRSLNESQHTADKAVLDLASGRDLNFHNTMVRLEEADIALKYTVQLRNRALSAYEELMRIQV